MDGTGTTTTMPTTPTGHDAAGTDAGTGRAVRRLARSGALTGVTAGLAPGYVQCNLAVLPAALADDFALFCQRNPQACPLLGTTAPGDPRLPGLGPDLDLRTDLPRYRVWRDGELIEEPGDVLRHWRDDLVGFAIGCSFTFESALVAAGLVPRHVECGHNVPMFRTRRDTVPAGRFRGPLVVSMRPMLPADAARAAAITAEYPDMHGAPVHVGDPAALGIDDLSRPDYGEPSALRPGEVPVFWACGVTPQAVLAAVRPDFAITHAPGCMLLTDRRDAEYRRAALRPAGTPLASPPVQAGARTDAAPLAPGAR